MFVNGCRVFRFYRITNVFNYFTSENMVKKQIIMIVNSILNIIFIISGLMQIVESSEIDKLIKVQTDKLSILQLQLRKHFHHYLYYTVVSISTVGFGDIYPYTIFGKLILIPFVFIVLTVIQHQINDLIILVGAQSKYARNSYSAKEDLPHILLVGNINTESLKSFCHEFFHPDHGSQYRHAVILNPRIPPRDLEIFLHNPEIENYIFYLEGDPLNEKDLFRADVHKAKACIIFNDKNSKEPYSGDHQSIFLGIFIKKFVRNHNRELNKNNENISITELMNYSNTSFHICLQLNKPESIPHFSKSFQPIYKKIMKPDQIIVVESLKMNLLSKSCITPGIMALVTNLIITTGDTDEVNEEDWMKEYTEGRGHEIYRIQLKEYYYQFTFMEIIENIYNQGQVIAFALEIEVGGVSIIKLNPSNLPNITILNLIEKTKDFSFRKKKEKDSFSDVVDFSEATYFGNTLNLNSKEREKERSYSKYKGEIYNKKNVKVFTYLICSDKSEADTIANKEEMPIKKVKKKEVLYDINNEVKRFSNEKLPQLQNNIKKIIKKTNSINQIQVNQPNNNAKTNNLKNSINSKPQKMPTTSKGIFKELLQNINTNINRQKALIENETSSESEEDIDNENMIHLGSYALEVSNKDYHIIENQEQKLRSNIEITHQSIKDREDISHHIIICGLHPALLHFILPLRAKYLQEDALKWIVILAPYLPQSLFEAFSKFNRIIFIQGSPLLPENLFRANVMNADKAVILSSGESNVNNKILEKIHIDLQKNEKKSSSNEKIFDAETIFIYNSLRKCNKNLQIMTELISSSNIEYLLAVDNLDQLYNRKGIYAEYEYTPLYASGEIFTPSIIDYLTCQSYFNPHIIAIIELLLGGQRFNLDSKTKQLEEFYGLNNSNLYLIKIPVNQVNETFAEFYYFLLRHRSIAIALYRKNNEEGFYYVYTNPKKTTLLRDNDFVFILSNNNSIIELVGDRILINEEESNNSYDKESFEKDEEQSNLNISNSFNNNNYINNFQDKDKENNSKNISKDRPNNNNNKKEQNGFNKINVDNSRSTHFDRVQERINKIQTEFKNIKEKIVEFPEYIEQTINKEIDYEMNIYLDK